jgi:hypothetical protein
MLELPSAERLTEIVAGILADATFMFVESAETKDWQGTELLCARLAMEHGERVELMLRAEPALGPTLAANLLGTEVDSEEARASAGAALGELANMVAGALAVEVFGHEAICHIGIPEVAVESTLDSIAALAATTCKTIVLTEEGHHLAVMLCAGAGA